MVRRSMDTCASYKLWLQSSGNSGLHGAFPERMRPVVRCAQSCVGKQKWLTTCRQSLHPELLAQELRSA